MLFNLETHPEKKMGISIGLLFDTKGVKSSTWQKIYNESLQLLNAWDFCDIRSDPESFPGTEWAFAAKAVERCLSDGKIGWQVCGDLATLNCAEDFVLYKDIDQHHERCRRRSRERACTDDDIYAQLACDNFSLARHTKSIIPRATSLFNAKTQGYPYHLYVLAIALLIENRLPKRVAVFGDITRGQMRRAIDWANTVLDKKLQMPDRADDHKLLERIKSSFPNGAARLEVFFGLSLSDCDTDLGHLLAAEFGIDTVKSYFKTHLKKYLAGMVGFSDLLVRYLNLGLDLESLCEVCVLDDDGCRLPTAEFISCFIDLGLHRSGDTTDLSGNDSMQQFLPDADTNEPQTVDSLLTGIFARAAGFRPGRQIFIPLDHIREVFTRCFGSTCNVAGIIEACLSKDEIPPADNEDEDLLDELIKEINKTPSGGAAKSRSREKTGDMSTFADLISWKPGQTFSPGVQKGLQVLVESVKKIISQKRHEIDSFFAGPRRKETLIELNRFFIIRETTWKFIFDHCENRNFYAIVCALLFINAEEMTTNMICKAAVNNIELFGHLFTVGEQGV